MFLAAIDPLGIGTKWDEIKNAVKPISDFCHGIVWIFQNPYDAFKLIMEGLCILAKGGAMIVCAIAILLYICGNEKAMKYVPTSIVIFLVLKVMVSVL